MCVGMFMALLDIQIVASSLQDIGGGLSAAQDQISWVQTAYLIAEIVMIPLSGWLTRVFSTRWLFTASAAGFTVTSMLCGLAWNIDSMIVFRALQGLLGASMIPTVFTSSFHYFQGPRRVYSAAVIGTIASVAPTLGPVIGGWITDTLELALAVLRQSRAGPGDHRSRRRFSSRSTSRICSLLKDADYPGIVLMAIASARLEYVLEEGSRWNWFDDATIRTCAYIAGIAGILFVIRSLTFARPVVDLRALDQPEFRARLHSVLRHRHRHLLDDLSDPAVSRLCARFQRLADRACDLLDRRGLADRRADLHRPGAQIRHALADDVRAGVLWRGDVELQLHHPRLGRRTSSCCRRSCAASRRSLPSRPP